MTETGSWFILTEAYLIIINPLSETITMFIVQATDEYLDLNPWPRDDQVSALPLCYHCCPMEQHALENLNNDLNTNISSYLETSGRQSSNLYLNVVNFFNASVN